MIVKFSIFASAIMTNEWRSFLLQTVISMTSTSLRSDVPSPKYSALPIMGIAISSVKSGS